MVKVSVIMPTYNAAKYLKEAVDSILNQTFQDFELLVIDDGSTDQTLPILKSYQDHRIRIVNGPRKGIAAALNVGLDLATGIYIARMDADDISMPNRFDKQVRFLDIHPEIGLCGTLAMMFTDEGDYELFGEKHLSEIGVIDQLFDTVVCHPTVMFRRALFAQYNLRYDERYDTAEDQELWSRALRYVKFYGIQEMLLRYRLHPQSASQAKHEKGALNVQKIRQDLLKWLLPTGKYDIQTQEKQIAALFNVLESGPVYPESKENVIGDILIPKMGPAFSNNNVPIITCSSDEYSLYCGVTVQSIIEHANPLINYDIVVLTDSITGEHKEMLEKLVQNKSNISVRFCYINGILNQYRFNEKTHITSITCSRLLIPEIFAEFDKVIWIDTDAVVNHDIADLYQIILDQNLIAAVHDIGMAGGDGDEQLFQALGMHRNDYVNAGVLLINCSEMRELFTSEELLMTATRMDFSNMDQDALNFHCKGKIKYLDTRWNVNATNTNSNHANAFIAEQYRAACMDPFVVHYIGPNKPWNYPYMPMTRYFWKYAVNTPFFEKIMIDCKFISDLSLKSPNQHNVSADMLNLMWPNCIMTEARWKRIIIWLLYDHQVFRSKVKIKLKGHPILYSLAKFADNFIKGIKRVFNRRGER